MYVIRNQIPGGKTGFSEMIWTVEDHKPDSHITLTYNSPDGQDGIYFLLFNCIDVFLIELIYLSLI